MIKNQDIICISSIDWDFIWQGHQEIMSQFARNGNRVLFIENTGIKTPTIKDASRLRKRIINWFAGLKGFRQAQENLFVFSPIILPFPYSIIARWINKGLLLKSLKRWMAAMEFNRPIVWTFLPTGTALDIIDNIDSKLLVYYCIADFSKLTDNKKKLTQTEHALIKKSDLIFVQGEDLKRKCRSLNNNIHIFPFGVNIENFNGDSNKAHKSPDDIKGIQRPIIGYIGGIHRHIDFDLVRFIAESRPEWSIVLVGPLQTDVTGLKNLKNVILLGKKNFSSLPGYIRIFDVCIIPYLISEYTATVFPTKLNEYHALGKPVVSTALPEIISFNLHNNNLVMVGGTYDEFVRRIAEAISKNDQGLAAQRIASAIKNNWDSRVEQMSSLIESSLLNKIKQPTDWRKSFLKFYTTTRKKTFGIVFSASILYFTIFYTPLVWFAASPLKISQAPENADCIVVFGGGVGESGRATEGYEERVKYAVELYQKRYAGHIIFSTGYTRIFKEPFIMKSLAISLGVPAGDILIEDKSASTYENVKFTRDVLLKSGWRRVLIISSPYHMLRASFVFKKTAPDLIPVYTPVPQSQFYRRGFSAENKISLKQISLQQIRGIIHEYLGIVYYWFKGYI